MFKSSENLRLAAEMRALQRVAAPWRESRTSWFDGTPDSIAARIAQTDKVLTHARSGFTPAHLELTREAEAARRELTAAQHRLLTDFLDDGARRSRRVAGDGLNAFGSDVWPGSGECRHCGEDIVEASPDSGDWVHPDDYQSTMHDGDYPIEKPGRDHVAEPYDDDDVYGDDDRDPFGDDHVDREVDRYVAEGLDRSRDWGHLGSRVAAIEFLADQNTGDRSELLFRAHRHASDRTGQLPVPVAQRVVRDFVAAVNREIPDRRPAPRTASAPQTVPDFDDTLLFSND